MVRERIKELVDFATTESPYRDANKGWLTDDVYLQWGKEEKPNAKKGSEVANVSIFWNPINQIAVILLAVFFLASILVYFAVSISHGRIGIPSSTAPVSVQTAPFVEMELELETSDSINAEPSSTVAPIIERKVEIDGTKSSSEFAAAALGGKKFERE